MNKATLRGTEARIVWGYQPAVRLCAWSVENTSGRKVLTGSILETDPFRVAQQPLTFVVSRSAGLTWRWPVDELHIADRQVTATLGPQE